MSDIRLNTIEEAIMFPIILFGIAIAYMIIVGGMTELIIWLISVLWRP